MGGVVVERVDEGANENQWTLHRYRYALAAGYVQPGDTVLDAACGTGYGKEILGAHAWIGVDREAPSVEGARAEDFNSWEPDFDYDIFVGLETIEHIPSLDAYVAMAKRAKRTIILSKPVIPTAHFNPWHVHDFTQASIESLFVDGQWSVEHFEHQYEPELQCDAYGIWAFTRTEQA